MSWSRAFLFNLLALAAAAFAGSADHASLASLRGAPNTVIEASPPLESLEIWRVVEDAEPVKRFEQVGIASWYGAFHHGRKTASGEVFDMHQLTAAHRSLPLGTKVRVTNLDNGLAVDVKINDRGPYVDGRVIDLSKRAAHDISMVREGVVPVKVEEIEPAPLRASSAREVTQIAQKLD